MAVGDIKNNFKWSIIPVFNFRFVVETEAVCLHLLSSNDLKFSNVLVHIEQLYSLLSVTVL